MDSHEMDSAHDMDDIFGNIFGGGASPFGGMGGFFGGGHRRPAKGENVTHSLKLSLDELYLGKSIKLQLTRNILCKSCGGIGGKHGAVKPCYNCNGTGVKVTMRQIGPGMVQQRQSVCPDCNGEREIINSKHRCKACVGKKVVKENKIIEANVRPGMRNSQKIVLKGEGDQQPGVQPGDVIIIIDEKPHDLFQRNRDDIFMARELTLQEAICGFSFRVKHISGNTLLIKQPPLGRGAIIQPGDDAIRGIRGKGMPVDGYPGEFGNLYIKFDVKFPDLLDLTDEQYKTLEQMLGQRPIPPKIPKDHEDVMLHSCPDHKVGDADSDEEERTHYRRGHSGQRVQCAQQ